MSDKMIVLFVEGETDKEFYTSVIKRIHDIQGCFDCSIKVENIKGIGNYKDNALRKFKHLKRRNAGKDIFVFLCIDSDVFELKKYKLFDKREVKKDLLNNGAKEVKYIEAKQDIEDWFLTDLEGVINFLKLPKRTKKPRKKGVDALKELFSRANKVYIKGGKAEGLINSLDITKIMNVHCEMLRPLCQCLSVDCAKVCGK